MADPVLRQESLELPRAGVRPVDLRTDEELRPPVGVHLADREAPARRLRDRLLEHLDRMLGRLLGELAPGQHLPTGVVLVEDDVGMVQAGSVEVGVHQRARVLPLVSTSAPGSLLARVGYRPALAPGVAVDLLVRDADSASRQSSPELRGAARRPTVFLLYRLLLLVGQRRPGRSPSGVEVGHDPGLAPPLKELPQPARRDAPAGGHLTDRLARPNGSLRLADQPLDATVGELGHATEGPRGKETLPGTEGRSPLRTPLSSGRQEGRFFLGGRGN